MKIKLLHTAMAALTIIAAGHSHADDTELYIGETRFTAETRPLIMVIFDNSDSMSNKTEGTTGYLPMCSSLPEAEQVPYDFKADLEADPDANADATCATWPVVSEFDNSLNEDFIYFTLGLGVDEQPPRPDKNSDTKRFHDPVSGCDAARVALEKYGIFTGYIREHKYKGNTGSWENLQENSGANTIAALDCLEDFIDPDNVNGDNTGLKINLSGTDYDSSTDAILQGIPRNGADKKLNNFYTGPNYTLDDVKKARDEFSGGIPVTLYHPNYLRWYHATSKDPAVGTRLEDAQQAVTQLIETTPIGDYAVMVFNYDYPDEFDRDGGRVVVPFGADHQMAVDTVNAIEAETNTPICETVYEALQYFSGNPVDFGDDDSNCSAGECDKSFDYKANTPPYDTSIIDAANNYITPFKEGCARDAHIILITDGDPTLDAAADAKILARIQVPNQPDVAPEDVVVTETEPFVSGGISSYLPNLAHWMRYNDVSSVTDTQHVTLHTIGFGDISTDGQNLLEAAAAASGGIYGIAKNQDELRTKFKDISSTILQVNSTFTSAAVASNNFDRTQTLDSVYYSMFFPRETARWSGNLKKLKFSGGAIVDANGLDALDSDTQNISKNAVTYWSVDGSKDGPEVVLGGANANLATFTNRTIYTDTAGSGAVMEEFNKTNAAAQAGSASELATYLGVTEPNLDEIFSWTYGQDIDDDNNDGSTTDRRQDIMGDPLHSKPLAIAYKGGIIRVALGTNAGSFHLFKDSGTSISEEWSFIPYELYPNLSLLRANPEGVKLYGIDGSPVMYFDDVAGDGLVDPNVDTVWLFVGMRRGGQSYYAFDITSPTTPKLMWRISSDSVGFAELGQSWSQPKVTYVQANGEKPVLVFGAGYDINKDNDAYSADNIGRGIFIVDAETGSLVWKTTPAATSSAAKNTFYPGVDSVPAAISIIDSDYDGYTDRLYSSDTGGNVWRIDMPTAEPFGAEPHTVVQLASLSSVGDRRRFFYEPVVARTYFSEVTETSITENGETTTTIERRDTPYEAVLVGSGNRAHPNGTTEANGLFMIRDEHIITESLQGEKVPDVIYKANLMDVTADPFSAQLNNDEGFVELEKNFAAFDGWQYNLSSTEKSLAPAVVVGGIAYFTTFTPNEETDYSTCQLKNGEGALYGLHLHYGATVFNKLSIPNRVPDTPQLYVSDEGFALLENVKVVNVEQLHDTPGLPPKNEEGVREWTTSKPPSLETHRTYIYQQEKGN